MATECRDRQLGKDNLYQLGPDGLEPITMVIVVFVVVARRKSGWL